VAWARKRKRGKDSKGRGGGGGEEERGVEKKGSNRVGEAAARRELKVGKTEEGVEGKVEEGK